MEDEVLDELLVGELERLDVVDVYTTNFGMSMAEAQGSIPLLKDIEEKDATFRYTIIKLKKKSKYGHTHIVRVSSDTEDQAHKRGVWLVNNLGIDKLYYWVK